MKTAFVAIATIYLLLTASSAHARDLLNLPETSNAVWFRYYVAGESARKSNNEALAQKYYLAALADVEHQANPKQGDPFFLIRLSALEQRLTELYKAKVDSAAADDKSLDLKKEQSEVLTRIAVLNERLIPEADKNRLREAARERATAAQTEFKKAVEAAGKRTTPKEEK
jgi:hypothetical protein